MSEAVADAFRYSKLVLGSLTYNGEIFPPVRNFIHKLTERNYQNRTVAFIENGTWAPTATRIMKKMLEDSKNLTLLDAGIHIKSAMNETNMEELDALADELTK